MNLFKVSDIIEFPMLAADDFLKRRKGHYLKLAPLVYADLNMNIIRKAVRQKFVINRRTNTVDLPCNTNDLCSVSHVDHHGCIHPLYVNDCLHDDLVVIPAEKDCNCEYSCGFKLCNTIKGYEAIKSVKSDLNPDGSPVSFNCVDRVAVDKNGFLYSEKQYPLLVYTAGVWTSTVLHTEITTGCKLEPYLLAEMPVLHLIHLLINGFITVILNLVFWLSSVASIQFFMKTFAIHTA